MPKVDYQGITFDSELELEFYKYLDENLTDDIENGYIFSYQALYKDNPIHINLGRRKNYTPDFIIVHFKTKTIYIIETKGYAKWSANEDNNIMDFMKNKELTDQKFLQDWLNKILLLGKESVYGYQVKYHRIKHLKGIGFVDYNYKNPNSLINQKRRKITELEQELKELKQYKKDCERYFDYDFKVNKGAKLNKRQLEWYNNLINVKYEEREKKDNER